MNKIIKKLEKRLSYVNALKVIKANWSVSKFEGEPCKHCGRYPIEDDPQFKSAIESILYLTSKAVLQFQFDLYELNAERDLQKTKAATIEAMRDFQWETYERNEDESN